MPQLRDARGRFTSGGGSGSFRGSALGSTAAGGTVGMKLHYQWTPHPLERAVEKGTIFSLTRAGFYIRKIAMRSIAISDTYSEPGNPPHSRRGQLKNAIWVALERARDGEVVIGPTASEMDDIGHLHEFGGTRPPRRKDEPERTYPARPFMGPALEISRERLPSFWANSVKGG